jgi:Protein of unknown function (DUF4238)
MAKDHYVPQFYLRNFSPSQTAKQIYQYRRGDKPELVTINRVACEVEYYPGRVDKAHLPREPSKSDAVLIKVALDIAKDTAAIIEGRHWRLLESTTSRVFVTSDNPLLLTRPEFDFFWRVIGLRPGSVLLPLSPKRCLLIDDSKGGDALIPIDPEKVDQINHFVMRNADKALFANLSSKTIAAAFDRTT